MASRQWRQFSLYERKAWLLAVGASLAAMLRVLSEFFGTRGIAKLATTYAHAVTWSSPRHVANDKCLCCCAALCHAAARIHLRLSGRALCSGQAFFPGGVSCMVLTVITSWAGGPVKCRRCVNAELMPLGLRPSGSDGQPEPRHISVHDVVREVAGGRALRPPAAEPSPGASTPGVEASTRRRSATGIRLRQSGIRTVELRRAGTAVRRTLGRGEAPAVLTSGVPRRPPRRTRGAEAQATVHEGTGRVVHRRRVDRPDRPRRCRRRQPASAPSTSRPGARTAWHSHSTGQTLYVTDGEGRCSRGAATS